MVYYPVGNGSKNYLTKKASQPSGNLVVKKTMISGEKHEKSNDPLLLRVKVGVYGIA